MKQKLRTLWNVFVIFFAGGFITGVYMDTAAEKAEERRECSQEKE